MRRPFNADYMTELKIDPLAEIRNAGIITNGEVFWVSNESDSDHRSRVDSLGRGVVKTGIQAGIDAVETDQNDYVMVIPQDANADWTLGTALDINEDRTHLLAVGHNRNPYGYALTVRYNMGTSPDTELVAVTGAGVEIGGFRFLGTLGTHAGGTMSNALLWAGTGASGTAHDLWVHDTELEANHAAGTPPLLSGPGTVHGGRFDNVRFATFTDSPENGQVVLQHGGKRWEFHDSRFEMDALATTDNFVECGTGATEYVLFRNCSFVNVEAGTAPASAFVGSVDLDNPVMVEYSSAVNVTAIGTDPGVFVVPNQSGTAAAGIHNLGIAVRGSAGVPAA